MKALLKEDARWAIGWSAIAVTLASAPYLAAYIFTPPGEVFSGLLSNPQDANSYLAKMRQGYDGGWLFHLPFTAEEHSGAPLFFLYILLGKLASILRLNLVFTYHLARAIFGLVMLLSVHCLYVKLTTDRRVRRSAFLLLAFGSGLSWLIGLRGHLATDLTVPESNTFHILFASPHFSFALAALVWSLLFHIKATEESRHSYGVLSGALALAAVSAQPFLYLTFVVIGLIWSTLSLKSGNGTGRLRTVLGSYALLSFIPLPFLLLVYLYLYWDPVLARWTSQNVTLSPPLWDYILGYGLPFVLAILGAKTLWRSEESGVLKGRFIVLWLISMLILVYLPVAFQRRLSFGLHVPLSLAAGVGLIETNTWLRAKGAFILAAVGLSAPTSLFLAATAVLGPLHLHSPFYILEDEVRAYNWLRNNTEESDIVMAGRISGNQIPGWTGRRVVWGHRFETIDADRKLKLIEEFYGGGLSVDESVKSLTDIKATILYYGQMERGMGRLPAGIEAVIDPIYHDGNVEIFRVNRGLLED